MQSLFHRELENIKDAYNKAHNAVAEMAGGLKNLFKEKTRKIKESCMAFFSKIELQVDRNTTDVVNVS